MIAYLITDPTYYSQTPIRFKVLLHRAICKKRPTWLMFRDKTTKRKKSLAKALVDIAKFYKIKAFINEDIELARRLGCDGVHLTSRQFSDIPKLHRIGKNVGISTHSLPEVRQAKRLRSTYVTYSPIFYSPGKGTPKGLKNLAKAANIHTTIALGGIIRRKDVQKIKISRASGFASIRFFID